MTIKGLEALANIVDEIRYTHRNCKFLTDYDKKQVDIIEKELKALEIIKKKRVNVHKFMWCIFKKYSAFHYNFYFCEEDDQFLDEEEFELLKEILWK